MATSDTEHVSIGSGLRSLLSLLAVLVMCGTAVADRTAVGESLESTATERNNARLVAEDLVGKLHVVYYDYDGIYHSVANGIGAGWSLPELVALGGRNPSIAVDSDNVLHLVYRIDTVTPLDILHRTFDGDWSEAETVYHDGVAGVTRPVVAVDSENGLHCVWQRQGYGSTPNSEVWYACAAPGGGWGGTMVNVSSSYGASEYPTLTIDPDDNIYVFWKDSGEDISADKKVLLRKHTRGVGWDANYTNVSNTTGNGSYATMDPCAVVGPGGTIHLVWKDSQPGNREIFYKACVDGIWDAAPTNVSETSTASGRPSISVDDTGLLYVAWEEKTDGVYYDIVRRTRERGGAWSEMVNISDSPGVDSRSPSAPLSLGPALSCLWTEGESAPYDIAFYFEETTGVSGDETACDRLLLLERNHPNPFSSTTTIRYEIPEAGSVTVKVYDVCGRWVRTIVSGRRPAGTHETIWDGKNDSGEELAAGVYFCTASCGGRTATTRMVIVR
jgi:hypothetical protein